MNCLFCKIANHEISANIVFDDHEFLGFRDINPQASTHILIIPKRHISSINDTNLDDEILLGKLLLRAKQLAQQENLAENGYRLVINTNMHGGQTVNHLHIHILGGRQFHWPPG